MTTTDERLAAWRADLLPAVRAEHRHLQELETALRRELASLEPSGLPDDEAWLLAVKRLGDRTAPSTAAASERTEQLSRQLARAATGPWHGAPTAHAAVAADHRWRDALVLAVAAAVTVQLARLVSGFPDGGGTWLVRNASLLVLPFLAAYLVRSAHPSRRQVLLIAGAFVAAGLVSNLFPFVEAGATEVLAIAHLPVALWAVVGYAWLGADLRGSDGRMALVRSSGSWFVTYVLFALGGGVLVGLTLALLAPTGLLDAEQLVPWVLPSGAAGAVVIAAWLVETRPQVVGAVAPMLAQVFTPLFAVMLVGVTAVYAATGLAGAFDRALLATFDALLVVVVGLVLYGLAARDVARPAGWSDRALLVTVLAALVLDLLVLGAMAARIGELGLTPNRVAAIGLNLVLLGNLVGTAWHGARFVSGRGELHRLLRWQTAYLPVFPAWAAVVVVLLPPLFRFA
ncbi:MAG: hypothetical protein ACNA8R_10695 [Nitriliruptoraceae bacterium]